MSIYIKGLKMPTSCSVCWALDDYGDYPRCCITEEQRGYTFPIRQKRMDNCPLVPVPSHEGDNMTEDLGIIISKLQFEPSNIILFKANLNKVTSEMAQMIADNIHRHFPNNKIICIRDGIDIETTTIKYLLDYIKYLENCVNECIERTNKEINNE